MRFLCDENIVRAVVDALASRGHDVIWVGVAALGARDRTVHAPARSQARVLM